MDALTLPASAITSARPESRAASSRLGDLWSLSKPGIIWLQLLSTFCAMILASGGLPPSLLCAWTLTGGALLSASAGCFNCIWDRDIDRIMDRTMERPLPGGRLSVISAAGFSLAAGLLGFSLLLLEVNAVAAFLALAAHLYYSVVYTVWLKRRTPLNIVIGGAAGGIPPLVGWAAVTGGTGGSALVLFLVICLWTPPHFWSLALARSGEYRKAGIPMLSVTAGEEVTVRHMRAYAALLLPAGLLLALATPGLSIPAVAMLTALGIIFTGKIGKLFRLVPTLDPRRFAAARDVFRFSIIYLTAFFLIVAADVLR